MSLTLEQTQKLIWQLISDPHGVKEAIQKMNLPELPICGDHRLNAEERLNIYAQMYFFRLLNCLQEDYPALLELLGFERFASVIASYVGTFPSEHWSLRYAGSKLPAFLETSEYRKEFPYLPDLARFEWQLLDIIDAEDSRLLSRDRLATLSPEAWESLKFLFIPTVRLLTFSWNIAPLYEALRAQEKQVVPEKVETTYLIWRPQFEVKYYAAYGLEKELLLLLHKRATFGELCERACDISGETGIQQTAQLLQNWIENGLLADFV